MKLWLLCGALCALSFLASGAVLRVQTNQSRSSLIGAGKPKLDEVGEVVHHMFGKALQETKDPSGDELPDQSREWDQCGVTTQTTATSQRGKNCPASCPLYVQDKTDSAFCSFRCVPNTIAACKTMNPNAPVPDLEQGICRGCEVSGCRDCAMDGTDTCLKCKAGQKLSGGFCYDQTKYAFYAVFVVVGLVVVFIGSWITSLVRRPITNPEGVDRGLETRSAAKLHQPVDEADPNKPRELWPLSTNLLTTPVAGNGVLHLFNFQFLLIVWAIIVVIAWVVMGYAVDTDFFRLGTRSPGETPRDNCIIIAWGFTTQSRLMYAKYMFCLGIYLFSFVGALLYAVFQLRRHQRLDEERISHKDFCAKITGLPCFSGKKRVEDELREVMQKGTEEKVVGVSICWDFDGKEDNLMKIIDSDIEDQQDARYKQFRDASIQERVDSARSMNWFDKVCAKWEAILMSPVTQKIVKKQHGGSAMGRSSMARATKDQGKIQDEEAVEEEIDVVDELEQLYSTEDAFVVFDSEAARDAAIAKVTKMGGVDFYQSKLQLEETTYEPQTVNWTHITNRSWAASILRIVIGFLCVIAALLVWCFVFYLPYAQLVVKSDYAHGKDPNMLAKTMFGFVVVGGNAMMYVVCAEVSDRVGFKTQAKREVCYMLLYCFACVFNVVLDLVMGYKTAYYQMVGMGVKTHTGERLGDVDTFADRFDAYAMQKSLGQILSDYSYPSTFLIPFLVEPFVVVIVPYQLMVWMIRTNPAIMGSAAEAYLQSTPMDLSRYADVLLNLFLAVLMFFFPGGYLLKIFVGLIISHIWIYAYDHYRVLSSIPACDYSTMDVDWWAQWMLSVPCGLLLSCAAFKANCEEDATHCWQDGPVIFWCTMLFLGHIVVHTLVLLYIVPMFGYTKTPLQEKYQRCSELHPCSWFSANPVHCLRSRYIFEHDPPCDYFVLGKDHLLRKNEKIGNFYVARTPRKEEFDGTKMLGQSVANMEALTRSAVSDVSTKIRRSSSSFGHKSAEADSPTAKPSTN
jgi:hypothetical protein